ncbi:MAG: hypothetical protein Kilf2KO_49040 [Rhodospirillales bacterium]
MIDLLTVVPALHRGLIAAWLKRDHVSRWWGDPAVCLAQCDATPSGQHALIAERGMPIGYLRWGRVEAKDLATAGLVALPEGFVDIDILIGAAEACGQGAGPRALRLLFDHLEATTDAPLAGLCSALANRRAHAAFQKVGCRLLTQFDDPTHGPCLVHIRDLRLEHPLG